ncbi:hypothetical protein QSJ19_02900 [Gordonia sp. ABSL11-1]|uniref:hypothetical protein n=1 Tax=Gordonia sp. ABSL11-1 TaxID=3053924 RepID=UPI002572F616|nr:hypothetical protein [Gordonia sp. ABSL11-1]MDL9944549.1 hypothetical protein [Gordonia sp. ABSL11-1]
MPEEPGVREVVSAIHFLTRTGGSGAIDSAEVAEAPALQRLADVWHGGSDATGVELVQRFLRALVEEFGSPVPPEHGGPRAMSEGNVVVVVGRMLRLNPEVPAAITHRRRAAVAGLNVSIAIFRNDEDHNKFDQYVVRFAQLALQFAEEGRANRTHAVGASPNSNFSDAALGRVERLSRRYIEDVGAQHLLGRAATSTGSLYVTRDVEAQLEADLLNPGSDTRVLVGEAGYGKTSLLWSLCNRLERRGRRPLLVSATWLQGDSHGERVISARAVVDEIAESPKGAVLLLDTADLLLHSESARVEVVELVGQMKAMAVPTIISTRPLEARSLAPGFGRRVFLEAYDLERELPNAIGALAATYCSTTHAPTSDAVAAILSARARGLIVDEVCRSPLLLRLLFELSAPHFPLLEIDVTGLYDLFWERRIATDVRHLDGVASVTPEDDLSDSAGLIAIAMLALGSPEPSIASVVRRGAEAARNAQLSPTQDDLTRALSALEKRGVVVTRDKFRVHDRSVRYFHQTFFEYAAAKGLCGRGADREVPRLVRRLRQLPDDLFVGAVLEQVLVMLANDELARPVVKEALRDLVESEEPNLVAIAMVIWAHHPWLLTADPQLLSTLSTDALRRFVRSVSGVHSDPFSVAEHLNSIWIRHRELRTDVVAAALSLVGRSPAAVTEFVRLASVFSCLAVEHAEYVRANAEPRVLLSSVIQEDPALGRDLIHDVIYEITLGDRKRRELAQKTRKNDAGKDRQGKEAVAQYLRLAAAHWPTLGSDTYLRELEDLVDRIQDASGDSDSKVVRDALAEVIAARWIAQRGSAWADEWAAWVAGLCRSLESQIVSADGELRDGDQSPILGSRLVAVGLVLATFSQSSDTSIIDTTVAILFGLSGPSAPRQLGRGCVVQVLIRDCPARGAVILRLADCLDGHLPAEHQVFVPGPELWAATSRMILMDSRIPSTVVTEVLAPVTRAQSTNNRLWTSPRWLVSLAAAAIVADDHSALVAIRSMKDTPVASESWQRAVNIFLDHARERAPERPAVLVPLALTLARKVKRPSTAKSLLLHDANREELRNQSAIFRDWIGALLTGTDKEQAEGADLLGLLVKTRVFLPEFDRVLGWYQGLRDPSAKANVLKSASLMTIRTAHLPAAAVLFSSIVTSSRDPEPRIRPARIEGRVDQPRVVDAARDALLEARAFLPEACPAEWDEVFTLMFAPRLLGRMRTEVGGAGNLSRFMTLEVENGYIDDVLLQLREVVEEMERLSATQVHDVANRMRVAVGTAIRHAEPRHFYVLADIAEHAPRHLRTQIARGLLNAKIPPDLERRLAAYLPGRPRIDGVGTFPEVLAVPAVTDESADSSGTLDSEISERRRVLRGSVRAALRAIRKSGLTSAQMGKNLRIEPSSYRALNVATASWRVPSEELCRKIDAYCDSELSRSFGLVNARRELEEAEERKKDRDSWTQGIH